MNQGEKRACKNRERMEGRGILDAEKKKREKRMVQSGEGTGKLFSAA